MNNRHLTLYAPCENIRFLIEPAVSHYLLTNNISILLLQQCMGWLIQEAVKDIFLCGTHQDYVVNPHYYRIYDLVKNALLPQVSAVIDFDTFSKLVNVSVNCKYFQTQFVLSIQSHEF